MSNRKKIEKVDIDIYFSDLDDYTKSLSKSDSQAPSPMLYSAVVEEQRTSSRYKGFSLQPYINQRSMLVQQREFSQFELESAYNAVRKLRDQLQNEHNSSLEQEQWVGVSEMIEISDGSTPRKIRHRAFLGMIALAFTTIAIAVTTKENARLVDWCDREELCSRITTELTTAVQPLIAITKSNAIAEMLGERVNNSFFTGLEYAYSAAEITQSAQTEEEWQQVIQHWELALKNLSYIASDSDLYREAQDKSALYRRNLAYAQQELAMVPFRNSVKAAEHASKLVQNAKTEEEWQLAVGEWQKALTNMQAVSHRNGRYDVAQDKLVEYSTKFAYAQKRYLDSQRNQRPNQTNN